MHHLFEFEHGGPGYSSTDFSNSRNAMAWPDATRESGLINMETPASAGVKKWRSLCLLVFQNLRRIHAGRPQRLVSNRR